MLESKKIIAAFSFFPFLGCTPGTWKFSGQGLNLSHNENSSLQPFRSMLVYPFVFHVLVLGIKCIVDISFILEL